MMKITVTRLKEVAKLMENLSPSEKKEVGQEGIYKLSQNLQRRMKYRAPKQEGWLKRSIMVDKTENGAIVYVNAYYGAAVEYGRSSKLYIPIEYLEQHKQLPEAPAIPVAKPRAYVRLSGAPHPFMHPALISIRPQIPTLLSKYIKQAIKNARR